ncbi:response regulator [Papillibacter cinnamivorans]|uniref:Stage 0 sporulation protein A homolog n=1 Tax=Papillibacter cinnamivorans DSM 12816 TaxID=1122930 RepID=A0A1W2AJ24_9FIRM|nr:response regulator [Papillibacter cinnamivorans]SMC60729.1 Response regulator receiver domain-containing protein [Papillibacter cinnamivorans DSM 12816]
MKTKKSRILIADDCVEFCDILNDAISMQTDMEVAGIAYNGKSAFDMIKKTNPDVVILDLLMPVMNGLEVVKQYFNSDTVRRTKFIILSAAVTNNIYKDNPNVDISYMSIKPIKLNDLLEKIRCISNNMKTTA